MLSIIPLPRQFSPGYRKPEPGTVKPCPALRFLTPIPKRFIATTDPTLAAIGKILLTTTFDSPFRKLPNPLPRLTLRPLAR